MIEEEPVPEGEDVLRDKAKTAVETPPEPVPGAEELPEDVPSEPIPEDEPE